ncbi:MAG: indolepyruvate oxidoreductase subunit beta [Clostridiales bacterium]|nr:indolepyruvate oxidoreductase subunit beta [Clostridiales bacterium]
MKLNVLISGVGGQGILLCGKILGSYALKMGLDVKVSEVHGMAQRGGCVVTHVRMDEKVYSPLIKRGEADAILAFEPMEALRYIDYIAKDGAIVTAADKVLPISVAMGNGEYAKDILDRVNSRCSRVLVVDGAKLAKEAGSLMTLNIVLLGAFTAMVGLDRSAMEAAIAESVKPQFVEMNRVAFGLGYDLVK